MTRPKWYSPQLSRGIVRRLYFKAKAERIPMTVLLNRLVEEALGSTESIDTRTANENKTDRDSE